MIPNSAAVILSHQWAQSSGREKVNPGHPSYATAGLSQSTNNFLAETTWYPGGSKKLNGLGSHFRHGRDIRPCGKNLCLAVLSSRSLLALIFKIRLLHLNLEGKCKV